VLLAERRKGVVSTQAKRVRARVADRAADTRDTQESAWARLLACPEDHAACLSLLRWAVECGGSLSLLNASTWSGLTRRTTDGLAARLAASGLAVVSCDVMHLLPLRTAGTEREAACA
jgi:hypothetical protein